MDVFWIYIIKNENINEVNISMDVEKGKILDVHDVHLEGMYFDEDDLRSVINHFSAIINSSGIVMSILDELGRFKGEIFLNPGKTTETESVEKCEKCKKRKIFFGIINRFDEEGNIGTEYFTGFIDEVKTIIITRGEDFKIIKKFQNPGPTQEIAV